jgi:hypothetical protein
LIHPLLSGLLPRPLPQADSGFIEDEHLTLSVLIIAQTPEQLSRIEEHILSREVTIYLPCQFDGCVTFSDSLTPDDDVHEVLITCVQPLPDWEKYLLHCAVVRL